MTKRPRGELAKNHPAKQRPAASPHEPVAIAPATTPLTIAHPDPSRSANPAAAESPANLPSTPAPRTRPVEPGNHHRSARSSIDQTPAGQPAATRASPS